MTAPTLADLDEATAATAATIADPAASPMDIYRAAEAEQAAYEACPQWPPAEPDPELEI